MYIYFLLVILHRYSQNGLYRSNYFKSQLTYMYLHPCNNRYAHLLSHFEVKTDSSYFFFAYYLSIYLSTFLSSFNLIVII